MHEHSAIRTLTAELRWQSPAFRRALRVALAVAIAVVFYKAAHLTHGLWLLLTVAIVLRSNLGQTFHHAWRRLVGTLAGVGVGIALVEFLGHDARLMTALLVAAIFLMQYLRRSPYALFCAAVSVMVILALAKESLWDFGIERVTHTAIGVAFALVVSLLVFPESARRSLPNHAAETVKALSELFRAVMRRYFDDDRSSLRDLSQRVGNLLGEARQRFLEASWEPVSTHVKHGLSSLEHRLLRINLICISLQAWVLRVENDPLPPEFRAALAEVAEAVEQGFETLAHAVAERRGADVAGGIEQALEAARAALATVGGSGPTVADLSHMAHVALFLNHVEELAAEFRAAADAAEAI